jgi:hypothetical protein
MCVCVCECNLAYISTHVWKSGQFSRVCSLLPPPGIQELSSGHPACAQFPLPTEPFHKTLDQFLIIHELWICVRSEELRIWVRIVIWRHPDIYNCESRDKHLPIPSENIVRYCPLGPFLLLSVNLLPWLPWVLSLPYSYFKLFYLIEVSMCILKVSPSKPHSGLYIFNAHSPQFLVLAPMGLIAFLPADLIHEG